MKEGKFMIQDLADVLSQRKNIPAEKAREVARLFFETILAGLEKDKFVKIKGLGTFKLVSVDNRESVDVNSGERIVIEGHSKVSFTPDNALKEAVNRPFAHFETVVLNEGVTDEQLEQIDKRFAADESSETPIEPPTKTAVEAPVEAPAAPVEAPVEATVAPVETPKEAPVEVPVEEPKEEPIETPSETPVETSVETPKETPKAASAEPVIPVVVQQETQMDGQKVLLVKLVDTVQVDVNKNATNLMENNEINNKENKSGKSRTALWIVCVVMALLLGYILGYFRVFGSSVTKPTVVKDTVYIEKKQQKKVDTDTVATVQEAPAAEVKAPEAAKPQPVVEAAKPVEKKPVEKKSQTEETNDSGIPQVKYGAYNIVGTQETYTVKKGETVRIIAERYLGARDMAIYISTYNRIKNPDLVSVGTVLKIPKLEVKKK